MPEVVEDLVCASTMSTGFLICESHARAKG